MPGAPGIDDVGVDGPDGLDVDLQSAEGVGQEAGQEYVGCLDDLVEQVPTAVGADVDPDAALTAVGLLDDVVDGAGPPGDQPHGDEAALRVASHGVLDLDHVGTPVGQHRARGWDEGPGRYLEYAETGE
jgi:hypothetical protein